MAAFLSQLPLQDEASLRALLGEEGSSNFHSEDLLEAIGQIAAPYDGGLLLDD